MCIAPNYENKNKMSRKEYRRKLRRKNDLQLKENLTTMEKNELVTLAEALIQTPPFGYRNIIF